MGKFTDWMMKGMDDGDDGFDKKRRSSSNNFDRYAENNYRQEQPYREERPTYSESRTDYTQRADGMRVQSTSTIPLMRGGEGSNVQNVVLYSPKSFEDVQTLIDFLKSREPSVVDLAGVGDASAQRILDFLSGAIYALSGSIHRISGSIFLLTPSGVTITVPNDVKRKLEGK